MDDVPMKVGNSVAGSAHWRIEDIDFSAANTRISVEDPVMLWLAAASSFIESASDIYTVNLVEYFGDDEEISGWLASHWESEELQHGRALQAYVEAAWPGFDWEAAFKAFLVDYSKLCSIEVLGPTHTLELASRCVIETGTSTLYRAIRDATQDPALRQVADHIQRDEVRHYKYFYNFFRRYNADSGTSRWAIAKILLARVREIRDSDTICALSHIRDGHTGTPVSGQPVLPNAVEMHKLVTARLRHHYPLDAAAKMLLAPLALPAPARNLASGVINMAARTSLVWSLL